MIIKKNILFVITLVVFTNSIFAQTCIEGLPKSTPTEDFIIHGNGTVTHKKTGLMWLICPLGLRWHEGSCQDVASPPSETQNWGADPNQFILLEILGGNEHYVDLFYGGYQDWRRPNIKEVASIIETSCRAPAINESVFPSISLNTINPTEQFYWSNSPGTQNNSVWAVNFYNGAAGRVVDANSFTLYNILVRDSN
jgi:hypothetical protein